MRIHRGVLVWAALLGSCSAAPLSSLDVGRATEAGDADPADARGMLPCCPVEVGGSCWRAGGTENPGSTCGFVCDCPPSRFRMSVDWNGCPVALPDGPPDCSEYLPDVAPPLDAGATAPDDGDP